MGIGMNEASTEQKLELIHQIRAQYNRDQCDMNHREQILYGSSYPTSSGEAAPINSTFKLRLFLAGLLLVLLIVLDMTGNTFAGIETQKIFAALAENFEEKIDWSTLMEYDQ